MVIKREPNAHGIYPIDAINIDEIRYDVIGKIALVDADLLDAGTRHPNLVIMKLAGYFKSHGCKDEDIILIKNYDELYDVIDEETNDYAKAAEFDAIYISKVFDFTNIDRGLIELPNVYIGGTGFFFDHAPKLPYDIEHHMPDYHIYDEYIACDTTHKNKETYYKDYKDYSIGFATRGCFRKCEFCVNHDCKQVEFHSSIREWYDDSRKAIYLWDDNILGYPKWRDVFAELKEIGKPFQFRQGMDIRLLTKEKARILSEMRYHGDYIFAFDHVKDAPEIERKLALWREHCHKGTKLYVLCGFEGQDEKEIEGVFYRISILIKYGCFPYIMRHELYEKSPYRGMFITLARWCNQPSFMRNYSFREFCEANQEYHKTPGTLCSAMKAMTDFESKHKDIAAKYFDMKFNQQPYVVERKKLVEEKRKKKRFDG